MELYYTFPGTHAVIAAEKALLAADIPVKVRPLPSSISAGCGLILCVDNVFKNELESELRANSIPFSAVYTKGENGFIKQE